MVTVVEFIEQSHGPRLAGGRSCVSTAEPCGAFQLVLLEYSTLEIGADPNGANSALLKSGVVGIRALWGVDAVVLNPSSFVVSGALS